MVRKSTVYCNIHHTQVAGAHMQPTLRVKLNEHLVRSVSKALLPLSKTQVRPHRDFDGLSPGRWALEG